MRILGKNIFPRTYFKLLKDAFLRLVGAFFPGNRRKGFTFIDKYAVRRIIDYYGCYGGDEGHQIDKKSGNLGYGFIHYALIRNLKSKRVLCVGSGKGLIPAICALACKDNQMGFVDFVDAGYGKNHPKSWAGDGFWKKVDPERHFSLLGVSDWIKTYVMTSQDFAKKFPKRSYGYISLDGDHSYEGVKLDYELFWPKLKEGGFMAFHDVTVKQWGKLKNFGVWKLWQELKNEHKIIFPLKQSGLGILQKD
ncbi:hypothetical protein COU95_00430 [Candidatus Shapirobacteria bacterium CG10_big_fil_rev_8_21_14_0_10_40_9]|uniref:Class I SAM-dependent methyltransferase n=1 Tax=Candidatus Shapirobacteria bacterium CG10_big_fil_rev_8_21_14_0_10_40_9 TaxID=1974888 RepID=A0A2M8L4D9_9BACT|nr:MAG: hypothetical protein COU95_00430 [Candidatus Shapirobacteria bacterium CG10_big_fil_rev_8_21_14_0_10_40_9]